VDEAQGSIVLTAKEMLQNGEIELSGSKDEELIY
jgi:flagellar motor switch protein FliG